MKIKQLERVQLAINPLVEVIAQISFEQSLQLDQELPVDFQKKIAANYPVFELQQNREVVFRLPAINDAGGIQNQKEQSVYQFKNVNKTERISLSSSFLVFATTNYSDWNGFVTNVENCFQNFRGIYSQVPMITRVGLRYRNVIDRKRLFNGVTLPSWADLIQDTILGHIATDNLLDDSKWDEADIKNYYSISRLSLTNYSLNIQSGFTDTSSGNVCFFIDNDFYNAIKTPTDQFDLRKEMEVLHADSESTFRCFIKEPLFEKLRKG